MIVLFAEIRSADREAYIRQKLSHSAPEGALNEVAARVAKTSGKSPPLFPTSDLPALSDAAARDVEARKICALRHIQDANQLADGEIVENETFTYLSSDHGEIPAGTPVLCRTTNMADLVYAFPNVTVDTSAKLLRDVAPVETDAAPLDLTGLTVGADPVSALGTKLALALLEKLGAMAWAAVFPPKPPSYFQQVYDEIRKIVRQELTEQNMALVRGAINGTGLWFSKEYLEFKDGGEDPAELLRMVRDESRDLHKKIGVLLEDKFAMAGLQVFFIAGTLHLALRQEMALLVQDNPALADQGAQDAESYPQIYAKHVEDTFAKIAKLRTDMVVVEHEIACDDNMGICKFGYFWKDNYTGGKGRVYWDMVDDKSKDVPGRPQAVAERETYVAALRAQLAADLGDPGKIAKAWRDSEIKV